MIMPCFVAAINSNGEPSFYFVKIDCTQEQFDNGNHYDAAMQKARDEGYEPHLAYDAVDAAGKAAMKLFEWHTADIVQI